MKFLFLILFLPLFVNAQGFDVGVGVGGSLYNGDLTVASPGYITNHTHAALSLNGAYHFSELIALRVGLMATNLSADDAMSTEKWQLDRNLNFTTSIYEFSVLSELNLLELFDRNSRIGFPFVYVGASAFSFNPKAEHKGQFIPLQPLGTEGQGMQGYDDRYDLFSFAVLFGLGYTYEMQNGVSINASFGWRRASTDYLDDISKNYISNEELYNNQGLIASELGNKEGKITGSQRGGQYSNDWFNVAMLSINYHFGFKGRSLGSRHSRLGCPSAF